MAETRPLHTTLVSCFVTLVLSISSLSEDPIFEFNDPSSLESGLINLFTSTGVSWFVVVRRLKFLGLVWLAMKNSEPVVSSAEEERNQGLWRKIRSWILRTSKTGIMTVCPIIIHINFPPHGDDNIAIGNTIATMVKEIGCMIREAHEVEELCPLVLKPSTSSPGDDVRNDMKQYYKYCSSSGGSDVERNSGAAAVDAERGDTMEGGGGGDEIAGSNVRNYEGKFLHMKAGSVLTRRIALLKLGLVPPYEQLRYLRKRSRFQTLVTVAQTLGFVMGLIERITQGLAISPLEALVSIFSVAAVLQMGLDLFTCASFNAPLFLHLTPSQFRNFILHHEPPIATSTTTKIIRDFAVFFVTAIRVGIAIGFIIYFRRPHLVAASSFIVYLLSILASFILFITSLLTMLDVRSIYSALNFCVFFFFFTSLLSMLVAFALALANTVMDWKPLYHESAQTIFAWLLPHVFSN